MRYINTKIKQPVINWHILEECNFGCKYCFAHWLTPKSEVKAGEVWRNPELTDQILDELFRLPSILSGEWAPHPRLNIAGGEPLLLWKKGLPRVLSKAEQLGFKLSIITNGSRLKDEIVRELAPRLQILGISMDSANPDTNREIGRCGKKKDNLQITPKRIAAIFRLAREVNPQIECKLNTVVCASNWQEDFHSTIAQIRPDRWKVFQMLPIADTPEITNKQKPLIVTKEQFRDFVSRHRDVKIMRPENNDDMTESYVMVDPLGRFYQNGQNESSCGGHTFSDPIYKVGVKAAWKMMPFDSSKFAKRYPSRGKNLNDRYIISNAKRHPNWDKPKWRYIIPVQSVF